MDSMQTMLPGTARIRSRELKRRTDLSSLSISLSVVILLLVLSGRDCLAQGVGISESAITPDTTSILELRSTVRGFLAPRMTTAQRTTLGSKSPAPGMLVYDLDLKSFCYWENGAWNSIGSWAGPGLTNGQLLIGSTDNPPVAATLTPGNGIAITNGSGSIMIDNRPSIFQVSSTTNTTTTSRSYVLAADMTLTPGAGDYLVFFTTSMTNTDNGKWNFVSIFANGIQIPGSEVKMNSGGGVDVPVAAFAYVTNLGSGQPIEVRWMVNDRTGTMYTRQLIVQKVK